MITPKEFRRDMLISHGVPSAFIDAIDHPPDDDFGLIVKSPDSAYFDLRAIESTYSILNGYDITPIYEGSNGDTYKIMLSNRSSFRFIYFELERDEIYKDYGTDCMLVLADLVIDLYEFAGVNNAKRITEIANQIGFINSELLVSSLINATRLGLRDTFDKDSLWRKINLPKIIRGGS